MESSESQYSDTVKKEGALLAYEYSRRTPVVHLALICLTLILVPEETRTPSLGMWLGCALAIVACRQFVSFRYSRGYYAKDSYTRLLVRLYAMVGISGIVWGVLPIIIHWHPDTSQQAFVPIFLAAIVIAGIGVFSSVLNLSRFYVLCICVPFILYCFLSGGDTAIFGWSVVAFCCYLMILCRSTHRVTMSTLTLKHDKEILIRDLQNARKDAEAANQAKSDFLAKMSHELRTPLNGILGVSELVRDSVKDRETKAQIHTIHESAQVLLSLVNDILDISKIEAGKLTLQLEVFSLKEEIERLKMLLEPLANQHGVQIHFSLDPACYGRYKGDVHKIGQVLTNLIGNGIKFTPSGGHVFVDVTMGEDRRIHFFVRDTGVGIPVEDMERIFKAFEQVEKHRPRYSAGTGLGLTICSYLLKLMGGRLSVETTLRKGSTFSFALMLEQATDQISSKDKSIADVSFNPGISVLVAEDNEVSQVLARKVLEHAGCIVVAVNNGAEALKAIEEDAFDIVLMDCQMPILNGYETTREIRRRERDQNSHLPVIALTAQAMEGDKELCVAAGMDGYVTKPFTRQILIDEIRRVLKLIP